jgi:hypothetical protein
LTISSSLLQKQQLNKKRRFRRTKQKMEYELAEIYKGLCNGETDIQIMTALYLQERNYYKYKKRLETRLMEYQRKKTYDTIFLESQLFKNRMLKLYKALENRVTSPDNTSGVEKSKCAEIAANIAIDVLKMESEGIHKVVKDALIAEKEATRRSSSVASISDRDRMMMEELEESC